jgi:hypothetical protein
MAAVAELKAILGLDTTAYKTGANDALRSTRALQAGIKDNADQIRRSSSIANGFGAILSGNVAQGLNSIAEGFKTTTGAATKFALALGSVAAAAGAAWMVGKKLDEFFGISDKINERFNRGGGLDNPEGDAFRAKMIDKRSKDMERERGSEFVKLRVKLNKELGEVDKDAEAHTKGREKGLSEPEKQAFDRRREALRKNYEEDLRKMQQGEKEKNAELLAGQLTGEDKIVAHQRIQQRRLQEEIDKAHKEGNAELEATLQERMDIGKMQAAEDVGRENMKLSKFQRSGMEQQGAFFGGPRQEAYSPMVSMLTVHKNIAQGSWETLQRIEQLLENRNETAIEITGAGWGGSGSGY